MTGQELWQILLGTQSGINHRCLRVSCEESFVRGELCLEADANSENLDPEADQGFERRCVLTTCILEGR